MKTISRTSARHRHISIISSRGLGANAGTLPANDEGPNFFFSLYADVILPQSLPDTYGPNETSVSSVRRLLD